VANIVFLLYTTCYPLPLVDILAWAGMEAVQQRECQLNYN